MRVHAIKKKETNKERGKGERGKGNEGIRVGNGELKEEKEWEAVLFGLLEWFTRFQVGASAVVPAICC